MGISPAEVRLRRLLAAIPQQQNQTKLLYYVASMREQLAALTGESGSDDLPVITTSTADEYAKQIDYLAESIDASASPVDVWESLRSMEDVKSRRPSAVASFGRSTELELDENEAGLAPQSPTLRRRRFQRESSAKEQGGSVKLDAVTHQLVDKHRLIQDSLTDEMALLSEQMKNNSLMMEQSLKDTEHVLDRTEEAVEHSLAATDAANLRAGVIYNTSWRTGCYTWLILFLMVLIFVFMIGVIRLTG